MRRSRKQPTIEFRLMIGPHFNERKQRLTTIVRLETTKSFASFQYDLSVRESVNGKKIHYKILGLNAPQLSLPAAGPALFSREYEGLKGTYEFSVETLDGSISSFSVRISPAPFRLLTSSTTTFVEAIVDDSRPL